MITRAKGRICASTGLRLIPAADEIAFRVAKDRYGALSVRKNSIVGPMPIGAIAASDPRGRYDTIGSTIYLADSRPCAYAEVLLGFRQRRAAVAKAAESIGWTVEDYITSVRAQAQENGVDVPWAISVDWQMDRSIYEIRLPGQGWWVQIDDPDTLRALETMTPTTAGMTERLQLLTSGSLTGEDRDLTTLLAHAIRGSALDDGSEPLGINYPSKTLSGRCWAYWDRRADEGLSPGRNGLLQLTSENVGPDPEFNGVAVLYDLPILGARS
jgi:hypothetical protein